MDLTYTLRNVAFGAAILGIVGGVLGSFTVLRKQSLLGDALAHAALPGVCLAFLLTGTKSPFALLGGAMLAGAVGSLVILVIVRWSRVKEDSAIGIVLSVFFGAGIVLLTYIQRLPLGNQSGLDRFLFGQAATLMPRDIAVMATLGTMAMIAVLLFYKEFKILCFDRDYGESLGFSMRAVEIFLTMLLVVVVVVGLQTVGVVLMVATLITPAAAARQWTDRLGIMLLIAATIGGSSGAIGALLSASVDRLPTGPTIVILSSTILVISLLASPKRGLFKTFHDHRLMTRRIRRENLLKDLYRIGEAEQNWKKSVAWPLLMGMRGQSGKEVEQSSQRLEKAGLVETGADSLRLTDRGFIEAEEVVRKHRLWEVYLTRQLELPSDHVHRDAEAMEHALDKETVAEIAEMLGHPQIDPHGRRIPPAREEK